MPSVSQPLKQSGYVNRKFDDDLDVLLKSFTIVEIEGVLGCGKTWTALAHAQSATTLGDTKMVLPIIQANPHIALTGVAPHLIDDWTNLPELQELMYRESGRPGSYIGLIPYPTNRRYICTTPRRPWRQSPYEDLHH